MVDCHCGAASSYAEYNYTRMRWEGACSRTGEPMSWDGEELEVISVCTHGGGGDAA